jgi:hypothetical protein
MQSFMNRSEAIAVLHEIYDLLKESVTVNHVSLDDISQVVKNVDDFVIIYSLSLQNRKVLA